MKHLLALAVLLLSFNANAASMYCYSAYADNEPFSITSSQCSTGNTLSVSSSGHYDWHDQWQPEAGAGFKGIVSDRAKVTVSKTRLDIDYIMRVNGAITDFAEIIVEAGELFSVSFYGVLPYRTSIGAVAVLSKAPPISAVPLPAPVLLMVIPLLLLTQRSRLRRFHLQPSDHEQERFQTQKMPMN